MEITDRALQLVAAAVKRVDSPEEAAARIVARPEGWGVTLDRPRPQDETFEHDERTVLVVEPSVAEHLQDTTLDVQETPEGPRLTLR